jgi:hypothetical protein
LRLDWDEQQTFSSSVLCLLLQKRTEIANKS